MSRAAVTLKRQMGDVVYPWVYTQVAACGAALDDICEIHGLWPTRLIAP